MISKSCGLGRRGCSRHSSRCPELVDVNSDQEVRGLQSSLVIDRPTAARLGITADAIDSALGNAFGQAQVSTIYAPRNQYRVVMEVAPAYAQGPDALTGIYVRSATGNLVPLSAFSSLRVHQHTADGQPPGAVRGNHDLLQSACRRTALRRDTGDRRHQAAHRRADDDPRRLPGNGAIVPAVTPEPAVADPRRAYHHLHRARHPVREPGASAHDSLHATLGRCRARCSRCSRPAPNSASSRSSASFC